MVNPIYQHIVYIVSALTTTGLSALSELSAYHVAKSIEMLTAPNIKAVASS